MYSSFTVYCFFMYFVRHASPQEEVVASYDGSQVWRIKLQVEKDLLTMKKLIDDQVISIWNMDREQADFLIRADDKVKVNRVLNAQRLNHSVLIMDVQRRVDAVKVEPLLWNENTLRAGHRLNWKQYPTLKIIDEYLVYLTENFPSICNVTTLAHTDQNRPIKMVKISNGNPNNKALLITSGSHAREWVAITSALYLLDKIVTKFDQLPIYMKTIDWLIIPVLNPDGFVYSHTHDRLWRKNRRKLDLCRGVDINRNFKTDWNMPGVTDTRECAESYAGPYAFSEAESIALRDMILHTPPEKRPKVLIDLHSYGQLILYPWSGKPNPTADKKHLKATANAMMVDIFNTTEKKYHFGTVFDTLYPASGAIIDWMYSLGVMSYALELGDRGDYGFLIPPEKIEPVGMELLAAVKEVTRNFDAIEVQRRGESWF